MNILDQSVNNAKILSRKLYNIPKCMPGDTSFKDSNRDYMGKKKRSQGQMFETPEKKIEGYFPH